MPYEYRLENLNRLSQISAPKHIKSLSNALYPGTHCPLFGAAMAACEIEGLQALVIGTDECTYYTQAFAIDRTDIHNNFWSYAMEHGDIVFGSAGNVSAAVRKINQVKHPQAILLITTCVPEITGENFDALAENLTRELGIPVLAVHTEHFRCNSHMSGIEKTLLALLEVMRPQPVAETQLNILGHRFGSIENSELFALLSQKGYSIQLKLPYKTTVAEISKAPAARMNIVADFTALPLAEKMKERFGTEYVVFDKFLNPQRIDASYCALETALGCALRGEVEAARRALQAKMAEAKPRLAGKTFIYGNSVMPAFEVSGFLCSLGMKPIVIQARDLYQNDDIYIAEILAGGHDPYVSSIANIAPLRAIYPMIHPDFYIGHENPHDLIKHGILQVTFDAAASKQGYELAIGVIDNLLDALDAKRNPMLAMMGMSAGAPAGRPAGHPMEVKA